MMSKLRSLLLLSFCLFLTGCSPLYTLNEDTKPKRTEWVEPEPKFELSQYQLALLYNGGLGKVTLKGSTGDAFTVIIPKFHTGDYSFYESPNKVDFQYTIVPPGTYYSEDGLQEKDYIVRTIEYVSAANFDNYCTNVFRKRLLNSVLSESDYDSKLYESYSDYVGLFTDSVNSLFPKPATAYTTVELTGEVDPLQGTRYIDRICLGDAEYTLPFETIAFKLSTGNYLCVRAELISADVSKLFETDVLLDRFVLKDKGVKQRDIDSAAKYLESLELDFESDIRDLMDYVIYGDYSSYYKSTNFLTISGNELPVKSDEPATFSDDVDSTDEPEESFGSEIQQKYNDMLNDGVKKVDPNKSNTIINGIDDLDTFGGYDDYDATDGGHFYED